MACLNRRTQKLVVSSTFWGLIMYSTSSYEGYELYCRISTVQTLNINTGCGLCVNLLDIKAAT